MRLRRLRADAGLRRWNGLPHLLRVLLVKDAGVFDRRSSACGVECWQAFEIFLTPEGLWLI